MLGTWRDHRDSQRKIHIPTAYKGIVVHIKELSVSQQVRGTVLERKNKWEVLMAVLAHNPSRGGPQVPENYAALPSSCVLLCPRSSCDNTLPSVRSRRSRYTTGQQRVSVSFGSRGVSNNDAELEARWLLRLSSDPTLLLLRGSFHIKRRVLLSALTVTQRDGIE